MKVVNFALELASTAGWVIVWIVGVRSCVETQVSLNVRNLRNLEDFPQSSLPARTLFILLIVSATSAAWADIFAGGGR